MKSYKYLFCYLVDAWRLTKITWGWGEKSVLMIGLKYFSGHEISQQFLWNDPDPDLRTFAPSLRGGGIHRFGEKPLIEFLVKNNLGFLIRSHEYPMQGWRPDFADEGRDPEAETCFTLFSAPNYAPRGPEDYTHTVGNEGAIYVVGKDHFQENLTHPNGVQIGALRLNHNRPWTSPSLLASLTSRLRDPSATTTKGTLPATVYMFTHANP